MNDYIEFLKFSDYRMMKSEWTVVAQSKEIHDGKGRLVEDYFIYPAILEIKNGTFEDFLKHPRWEVHMNNFGHPQAYDTFSGLKRKWKEDRQIYTLHPFVIFRESDGFTQEKFEIKQFFSLFFDSFQEREDEETEKYCFIDNDGNIIDLIKIKISKNYKEISVNKRYLEEFLDHYGVILVRYFDNRRFYHANDSSIESTDFTPKTPTSHFKISIWRSEPNRWISKMLGKDILIPRLDNYIQEEEHSTFKIKNLQGNICEFTCEEEKLGNLFNKFDVPQFLTPVFFKGAVLEKYYNEPRIFGVGNRGISCLNYWSMPFDQLEDGLIQVYLGDLAKLPFNHQKHWKIYNIVTDRGISYRRFMSDFQNDPIPTQNPITIFHDKMRELEELSNQKFGSPLIKPLNKDDQHIYTTLRIPLTNSPREFDEQISSLAKLIPESLNTKLLKNLLKEIMNISNLRDIGITGSINLLEEYLKLKNIDYDVIIDIIKPLRMIQYIRSQWGIAHRRRREKRVFSEIGLEELSFINRGKTILKNTVKSLESLCEIVIST